MEDLAIFLRISTACQGCGADSREEAQVADLEVAIDDVAWLRLSSAASANGCNRHVETCARTRKGGDFLALEIAIHDKVSAESFGRRCNSDLSA
jgi:hypothetical protein